MYEINLLSHDVFTLAMLSALGEGFFTSNFAFDMKFLYSALCFSYERNATFTSELLFLFSLKGYGGWDHHYYYLISF